MTAYYNEIDSFAAQWLRNLISKGQIAPGDVDERDIKDVKQDEIKDYTQHHFFAGIGGWSYALRLAGWPDTRPVWTGSCPCQPFSLAGRKLGEKDDRHVWPIFRNLIKEFEPTTIFGEQVASKAGRAWCGGIQTDLEALGYITGAVDLCSAGIGSPNIRQRLYWVANAHSDRANIQHGDNEKEAGFQEEECQPEHSAVVPKRSGEGGGGGRSIGSSGWPRNARPWDDYYLLKGADGKKRRVGSGISPVATGVSARVGRLRGYGNAINPWVAKEFIEAFNETRGITDMNTSLKGEK